MKHPLDPSLAPIQVLWVRGELSRMEMLSLRSFLAHGHAVHFYTYSPPSRLPEGVVVCDARDIVPENLAPPAATTPFTKGSMGAFSDYFRYNLLFQKGGWWSDLDVVALRPWRGFPDVVFASTDEPPHGRVANGFVMRLPAGHPVLAACLATFEKRDIRELDIAQTGPLLLHTVLGREGVAAHCQPPEVFAPVPWNAGWQLVRPLWKRFTLEELLQRVRRPHLSMRFSSDTAAVHLWHETWRHANLDKHAAHAKSSLYEKLQRRFNP